MPKMSEFEWMEPHYRFTQLMQLYNAELTDYLTGIDYDPSKARQYLIDFFDGKGKGEEIRELLCKIGA